MKSVPSVINTYLDVSGVIRTCDLYTISLEDGSVLTYAAYDRDILYNGVVYQHSVLKFSRDQIKLQGQPSVDSLNVTVRCEPGDLLKDQDFMIACHEGKLEQAMLKLSRAYFDNSGCLGAVDLFSGRCEISSAGGLVVKLNVKSIIQGLAAPVPVRVFASQSSYTTSYDPAKGKHIVTTSSTDTVSMVIPLKPSANVLLQI